MPRSPRPASGGIVTHVLNRSNARRPLFERDGDYELFEHTLEQAHARKPVRILSYCLMPNHWHLVLWPRGDGDLPGFMRRLTVTHTQRWHAAHGTAESGHVYQGRYRMFPVQAPRITAAERRRGVLKKGSSLWTVVRYVERNALRAGLVARAEQWRWGSLWRRTEGNADQRALLSDLPGGCPADWLERVNRRQTAEEERAVACCIARSRAFGTRASVAATAARLGLQSILCPRARPRNSAKKGS